MTWYDYLQAGIDWILGHLKQILAVIAAFALLAEFRAVLIILVVLALVYALAPEVRPYWHAAFDYFVYGLRVLVSQ